MDHAEARELLEVAALEPEGLDRLAAGDSPEAAALAGHLVGCPECTEELERLRRSVRALRAVFGAPSPGRSTGAAQAVAEADLAPAESRHPVEVDTVPVEAPPPELRERTLAYVRAVGRTRGSVTAGGARRRSAMPARSVGWLLGLAAALIVGIGIGGFAAGRLDQGRLDAQAASVAALTRVNSWTIRIAAAPGARSVALTSPSGSDAGGALAYSPTTGEIAVVMEGIAPPPAGREYRCWVRSGDTTVPIGRMYFGGDVGYWTGASAVVARLAPGATFGVSLVDASTGSQIEGPVLIGTL